VGPEHCPVACQIELGEGMYIPLCILTESIYFPGTISGFCIYCLEVVLLFYIVVLHATLYKQLDLCLGMLLYIIYYSPVLYYISYMVDLLNSRMFCLKLNWWSGIILVSCSVGLSLVRKSFSNNFERIGCKLMGL